MTVVMDTVAAGLAILNVGLLYYSPETWGASHQPSAYITLRTELYVVGSKSFRPDQLFKVTEIKQLYYFST